MADTAAPARTEQDVVTYSAFSGLRSDVDPERFGISDITIGTNIDIDKSGRPARRAGYAEVNAGATHSLWAQDDLGLFVRGSTLYQLTAAYGATAVRTGLTAGSRMSYQAINDSVFYSNGFERGELLFEVPRSWGIPVPALPGAVATVGNLSAGTYQYSVLHIRADGQESGAPLAGAIDLPAGSGLVFSVAASTEPDVVSKAIYITPPNGEILYRALVVSNATTVASYQNDGLELNVPLDTQFLSPPPAGHLLAYYRGRMYVAVDDCIYPSEPHAYSLFDLRKYIQLDGRITMMAPLEDAEHNPETSVIRSGIFVGTDRQCGALIGGSPEDFQYVPKLKYGAVLGAMDYVDGNLFGDDSAGGRSLPMFITTQGLCIGMPDMEIKNITRTKYGFPAAGQGAAYFSAGPNRFVAVTNF